MITKTSGVALGKIKYRETSIIARIFTEKFGLQSYLVNGIRTAKGKHKIALFQPLTLLDLVVYHKENSGIQRLSEVKCSHSYTTMYQDIHKSTVAIFLTEILEKTLRECSNPEEAFSFLKRSLIQFDQVQSKDHIFHLNFLIEFSALLGFKPQSMQDFLNHLPEKQITTAESQMLIRHLIEKKAQKIPSLSNATRRNCLNLIITYFKSHIDNLGEIKSVNILKEILD